MRSIVRLVFTAVTAWMVGLTVITAALCFSNGGAAFSAADMAGFGSMVIVGSALMMLLFYLPALFGLKRRLRAAGRSGGFR